MTNPQIDTGKPRLIRHGGAWFEFPTVNLYAPPKTGSTTLHRYFEHNRRAYAPPLNKFTLVSWRNPIDRWISAYNMIVIYGSKRTMKENDMIERMGQGWFDRWMPDPETIDDPVGHARRFLATAQLDIESAGWELHFCSQAHCLRRHYGEDWHNNPNIQLIPHNNWLPEIKRHTGHRITDIGNVGAYNRVPKHYYNTLRPALAKHFAEDLRIWGDVRINTTL